MNKWKSWFFFIIFHCLITRVTNLIEWDYEEETIEGNIHKVEGVLGHKTHLPCEMNTADKEDKVYMILWFKKSLDKPLYSFDVRGRSFVEALQWSDSNKFGPRANLITTSELAKLYIDNIQLVDEGVYRCRIDYKNGPTKNVYVSLTVIVPPHQIILFDNSGREVTSTVGPFNEGDDLDLTCEVRGGKPLPKVSWETNGKKIENNEEEEVINDKVTVSKLHVGNLTRWHVKAHYTCQASNTNLAPPLIKSVTLLLYLPATYVKILNKPEELMANENYILVCETGGSIPAAVITWWKKNKLLETTKIWKENDVARDQSYNSYSLSFQPKPQDNTAVIKCRASNPSIDDSFIEDLFTLNIVYAPIVSLKLGNLFSKDIKEGDDVYFECAFQANPPADKILWFHEDKHMVQNKSARIILSTHMLVLQSVVRNSRGKYTCQVTNEKGNTTSQPVYLQVKYSPVCERDTIAIIGASIGEVVNVTCQVNADPELVTFSWIFNNSVERFIVPNDKYHLINSTTSKLAYTVTSDKDYGTLTCHSKNNIGFQTKPCLFRVVQAAIPDSLTNCTYRTISNGSQNFLEVKCIPGFGGGLSQSFNMKIIQNNYEILRLVNDNNPIFLIDISSIDNLEPSNLQLVIYSMNRKGNSNAVVVNDVFISHLPGETERRWDDEYTSMAEVIPFLLVTAMVAVVIIVVLTVVTTSFKKWCPRHQNLPPKNSQRNLNVYHKSDNENFIVSYQIKENQSQPDILIQNEDCPTKELNSLENKDKIHVHDATKNFNEIMNYLNKGNKCDIVFNESETDNPTIYDDANNRFLLSPESSI